MKSKKFKVGLIGANADGKGWSPVAHIPALLALENIELAALCTSRPESAKAASKTYGIDRVYHNYKDLVTQPDIDIISVVVKIPNHYVVVKAALEAGKHVYCEWPLGATLQETEDLAKLANNKGLMTAIGLQGKWAPELLYIKELLNEGWFGQVLSVNMTMKTKASLERNSKKAWEDEKQRKATLFLIVGGHTLYYLSTLFGCITEVSSQITTQLKKLTLKDNGQSLINTIADQINIQGFLNENIPFTSQMSSILFHSNGWRLEICGTQGTIIATSPIMPQITPITLKGAKGDSDLVNIKVPNKLEKFAKLPEGPANNVGKNYGYMLEAIVNKTEFHPNFEDAFEIHNLLDIIQRSSDEKKTIKRHTTNYKRNFIQNVIFSQIKLDKRFDFE